MSNRGQHFISIQQYTININGIDYIERTEEWNAVIHFRGGNSLQLSDEGAKELTHQLESAIGAAAQLDPAGALSDLAEKKPGRIWTRRRPAIPKFRVN